MSAAAVTSPINHQATRELAVSWMNCGHTRALRGDATSLRDALAAYTEAVVLLRGLPRAVDPSWDNSLGAALMNQGQLLHRLRGREGALAAREAFDAAEEVLAPLADAGHAWARRNLAGTRLNRANLHLDLAQPALAECDAAAALELVRDRELVDITDAELALKARRALCDALGQQLAALDCVQQDVAASRASDGVDDALALARHWQARGKPRFSELAVRFIRFGAELYRRHQPHFLPEFLRENSGAAPLHSEEVAVIAREALDGALADGARPGRFALGDAATERALETRLALQAARTGLHTLSSLA